VKVSSPIYLVHTYHAAHLIPCSNNKQMVGAPPCPSNVPAKVMQIYQTRKDWKSASVLVTGWSYVHKKRVALLAGFYSFYNSYYRYADFGGLLDGGAGATKEAAEEEKRNPHQGAFRELAEELFGLQGDEAKTLAASLWERASANLQVGGVPVVLGTHLMFVVPAWVILVTWRSASQTNKPLAASPSCSYYSGGMPCSCKTGNVCPYKHELTGIDLLAECFVSNSEVSDVKLLPLRKMRESVITGHSSKKRCIQLFTPIWAVQLSSGKVVVCDNDTSQQLNQQYARKDDSGVTVPISDLTESVTVKPVSLCSTSSSLRVHRLEEVAMRECMVGDRGSMAAVFKQFDESQSK